MNRFLLSDSYKNWEEVQELKGSYCRASSMRCLSLLLVCGRCELLFQFHTSLKFSNSNDTWLSFELETVPLSLCICFSLILLFSCLSGQRHNSGHFFRHFSVFGRALIGLDRYFLSLDDNCC